MANKISCGGFYVDNETLQIDNGVLKVVGGGSAVGIEFIGMTSTLPPSLDKTYAEISELAQNKILFIKTFNEIGNDNFEHAITPLGFYGRHEGRYVVQFGLQAFVCDNVNDYPVLDLNPVSPPTN